MDQEELSIGSDMEEEVVVNNDSDDNEEYSVDDDTWIEWFCKLEGNHYFVEITDDFLLNDMNLLGLDKEYPNYSPILDIILGKEAPKPEQLTEEFYEKLPRIKELYGILTKRFVLSSQGLALVREKYLNGVYGVCPRILCNKQTVLPYGISNSLKYSRVNVSGFKI